MSQAELTNVLSQTASPYLQQHKDNPVHWQTWGEAALNEARASGKPILLSIGYAACHWCHVMAHESFEDADTAAVMNRLYVNIKVDREERSDIDQIYMAALHAMGEPGGWPLTIFLNPDGEPFWGGTYFPKRPSHGRPAFVTVLESLSRIYQEEPDKISRNTKAIRAHLTKTLAESGKAIAPDASTLQNQSRGILSIIDGKNGGIGQAPKFPNASMLETLIRNWRRHADTQSRDAALTWINALVRGGIYDHLGGGLARYCVDAIWLVPHFEKMLYDNAQLINSLLWAHGETGNPLFRIRIEETIEWISREMVMPGGGIASSLDADSEGEEGKFYIWQKTEIDTLLGEEADLFCHHYDVSRDGNWEGSNILNQLRTPPPQDDEELRRLAEARSTLLTARNKRVRPGLDDKILADWNGLAIRALAEAGRIFHRQDWIELARKAYGFVTESMMQEQRLAHAWCNGITTYPALASDYGAMINAAISLFESTGDRAYLEQAERWVSVLDKHYGDDEGGYFYTADDATDVLLRTRHEHDDAAPSASAQVLEGLARLSLVSENYDLPEKVSVFAASTWGRVNEVPMAASGTINAIDTMHNPLKLVLQNPAKDMIDLVHANPDPARIVLTVDSIEAASAWLPGGSETDSGKQNEAAAYLCRGPVCLPPVFDSKALSALLKPGTA
ncbi:MAG: thioredoxin domain-containing protein [Pseudomonadota bacterium]